MIDLSRRAFRDRGEALPSDSSDAAAIALPDEAKRQMIIELFGEFGIGQWREDGYELTHRCTLGLGGHSDGGSWTASVNFHKLKFNCFVCGNGGPLSWWIAVNRGEDGGDSDAWLRSKVGPGNQMALETRLQIIQNIINPPDSKPKSMPFYNDKILNRWNHWHIFHPYLTEMRHIPDENLAKFEVGYQDEPEDKPFNYFRRIILPVRWKGKLVGWQARQLDPADPDKDIKYKNSPDFPRDRVLYGDFGARNLVVVESPMSVLRHTHQRDIAATFGSKVTEAQLRLLGQSQSLTLFPDPDKAGYGWARKILNSLSRSVRISVVSSPYSEADAADLDDDDFIRLVDSAVPGALWAPKRYRDLRPYKG